MAKRNAYPAKVVKLLRKVQAHILEEPRRLNMDLLVDYDDPKRYDSYEKEYLPPCGTTACIAGWMTLLANPTAQTFRDRDGETVMQWSRDSWAFAKKTLGLGTAPGLVSDYKGKKTLDMQVFLQDYWPEPFRTKFLEAQRLTSSRRNKKKLAQITVDRIEHLIKTGK